MVNVAQLVERQVVSLDVAGSSPVVHPILNANQIKIACFGLITEYNSTNCRYGGMVDAADSKSVDCKVMGVQVPLPAP